MSQPSETMTSRSGACSRASMIRVPSGVGPQGRTSKWSVLPDGRPGRPRADGGASRPSRTRSSCRPVRRRPAPTSRCADPPRGALPRAGHGSAPPGAVSARPGPTTGRREASQRHAGQIVPAVGPGLRRPLGPQPLQPGQPWSHPLQEHVAGDAVPGPEPLGGGERQLVERALLEAGAAMPVQQRVLVVLATAGLEEEVAEFAGSCNVTPAVAGAAPVFRLPFPPPLYASRSPPRRADAAH